MCAKINVLSLVKNINFGAHITISDRQHYKLISMKYCVFPKILERILGSGPVIVCTICIWYFHRYINYKYIIGHFSRCQLLYAAAGPLDGSESSGKLQFF